MPYLFRLMSLLANLTIWLIVAQDTAANPHMWVIGKTLRVLQVQAKRPHQEPPVVSTLAIRPAGKTLAFAGDDHDIHLWDISTGELVGRLRGHQDWVRCLTFSSDGKTLISGGDDGQVLQWPVTASADKQRPRILLQLDRAVTAIQMAPSGKHLAVLAFREPLRIVPMNGENVLQQFDCPCGDMRAVAFMPSGDYIVAAGGNGVLRMWSFPEGLHTWDVKAHRQRIRSVTFSADGKLLFSGGDDRQLRVSNTEDGRLKHALATDRSKVVALSVINREQVAVGGSDNDVQIWNIKHGRREGTLRGHSGTVTSLQTSGEWILSGSFDTTVRIWRLDRMRYESQAERDRYTKPSVR